MFDGETGGSRQQVYVTAFVCMRVIAVLFPCLVWLTVIIAMIAPMFPALPSWSTAQLGGMASLTKIGLACLATVFVVLASSKPPPAPSSQSGSIVSKRARTGSYGVTGEDVLSPALTGWAGQFSGAMRAHCSIATALCMAMSIAQLCRASTSTAASDYLAGTTLLIAGAALIASLFHVTDLHHIFFYSTMAVPNAFAIWFLGIATIAADPSKGWPALIASSRLGGKPYSANSCFATRPFC